MRKFNLYLAIVLVSIVTVVSSCSRTTNTNNANNTNCTSGAFTVSLNGNTYTGSTYQNTLLLATSAGVDAKRLDIRATNSTGMLFDIAISDWRDGKVGQGMRTGTYNLDATTNPVCNSNQSACLGVVITYGSTVYLPTNATGAVTITSCDATNHKISGTISGSVQDFSGNTLTITNGTFTDMCYTVIQ